MKPIQEIILEFQNAIPGLEFISNSLDMMEYGSDYTEDLYFPPTVVCFPRSAEEISILVKICNQSITNPELITWNYAYSCFSP